MASCGPLRKRNRWSVLQGPNPVPRESSATLLLPLMGVRVSQGRNFSLKFSFCVALDKVQLLSSGSAFLGELQAQESRRKTTIYFTIDFIDCSWDVRKKNKKDITCSGRDITQNGKSCLRSCYWMSGIAEPCRLHHVQGPGRSHHKCCACSYEAPSAVETPCHCAMKIACCAAW